MDNLQLQFSAFNTSITVQVLRLRSTGEKSVDADAPSLRSILSLNVTNEILMYSMNFFGTDYLFNFNVDLIEL